ncbi:DUF2274 domain-containing protein [Paracoccus denitrificans]|uniref:DUF2274 domain-containing protein n=1 Tax=Paracoccus denitrificans TaxID=266 RepID=UPI001E3A65FB|nr:DUF2274 domain-containing protein [Paracoccus denitrificans]UFS67263.1 DUF2274 domain-containing protein [Paracoccus denitrificans]
MVKLKLGPLPDDKPVKLTVELSASLHRNMVLYGEILGHARAQGAVEPIRLIVPILERFIATDRGFVKARKASAHAHPSDQSKAGP